MVFPSHAARLNRNMAVLDIIADFGEPILEFASHCTGRFVVWAGSFGRVRYEAAERRGVFYRRENRIYVTSSGATLIGALVLTFFGAAILVWCLI
jgi:hypothetical protein